MKTYVVILLMIVFCFSSCSLNKLPMSDNEILDVLQEIKNDGGQICVMSNPMTLYEINVTDELIDALNVEMWQNANIESVQKDVASAMLYFDLFHDENKTTFTRVAILSNNVILTQICTAEGFEDRCWYTCSSAEIYNDLFGIIIGN